jgi:hypothetical protein
MKIERHTVSGLRTRSNSTRPRGERRRRSIRKKRGGATHPRKMASAGPQPGNGRALEFIPIAQLNRQTPAMVGEPRDAAQRALRGVRR